MCELTTRAEVTSTLSQLKLSTKTPQKLANKPKSAPVAESWDDELSGSGSDTETEEPSNSLPSRTKERDSLSPLSTANSIDSPHPPPPTPASPTSAPLDFPDHPYVPGGGIDSRDGSRRSSNAATPAKRPDKTTAVAGRMIAGALGVRAPRRTEEEREYDRAMRDKERKRRDAEREKEKLEQQAAEDRKRSVWED